MSPAKRCFDVLASASGLALVWPLFAVVALLVKIDDGGPVFFHQVRVGHRGRAFRMRKFRTMRRGGIPGLLLTVGGDPRITRVGHWLRKCKLDELPQLLHVLSGKMTLVGPRPEVQEYVARYTAEQRRVLEQVPGITDPASLRYWNEGELLARSADPERMYVEQVMPDKIRIQLRYGEESTVWTDILVILNTLRRLWPSARPLLLERLLRHRRPLILAVHILLIVVGYAAAFELRYDFGPSAGELRLFWLSLPALLAFRLMTYARFGLNHGYWQRFSLHDLINLSLAVSLSSAAFAVVIASTGRLGTIPASILLIDWAAAILLAGGVRFAARCLKEAEAPFVQVGGRRTLVVGARDKAEWLLRQARRDGRRAIRVEGFVAGPADRGRSIHGVPVLGTTDELEELARRHRIEFIVIALDDATGEQMRPIVERCITTGIEFKTLPSLRELLQGGAGIDQLRSVELKDLLGRESVELDLTDIENDLRGKRVLVTGGAGSIGSELARQVARYAPARLVLLDQAESALYFVHLEMQEAFPELDVVPVICDVTDAARLTQVVERHRPDYVIHAAAYKHVPMMEANVLEAVHNNVIGTLRVAECAVRAGAAKFLLISTDKAVNPSSVMGASKRIAERIILGLPALRGGATDFRAVRFGNVLGSNGSVIPLFERQLAAGGPITVTHRDVERYFMTIPEAAQLVLHAAALPEAAGRISMLDMGEPVRILDLAEKLVRLSGREPYRDIPIVFTGLRPGEKLQEELMSAVEFTVPTRTEKIRIVQTTEDEGAVVEEGLARLTAILAAGDVDCVLDQIRALVSECVAPLSGLRTVHQPVVVWERAEV